MANCYICFKPANEGDLCNVCKKHICEKTEVIEVDDKLKLIHKECKHAELVKKLVKKFERFIEIKETVIEIEEIETILKIYLNKYLK